MENLPPQPKRARLSIQAPQQFVADQQLNSSSSKLEASAENRQLPNELVSELCSGVQAVKVSERILLLSVNIHAYLGNVSAKWLNDIYSKIDWAFAYFEAIYRDAIAFLKARLLNKRKGEIVHIRIDQAEDANESDEHVVIHQSQSADEKFQLQTNQLHIRIKTVSSYSHKQNLCQIDKYKDEPENAHVLFLVRLLASLLRPIALDAINLESTPFAAHLLDALRHCTGWTVVCAEQLLEEALWAPLAQSNKLAIYFHENVDGGQQSQQFRRALLQWLNSINSNKNNNGQPILCKITHMKDNELAELLKEMKTEFCGATSMRRFAVRIGVSLPSEEEDETTFTERNNVGEQLQMWQRARDDWTDEFTLIRRPIAELDDDKYADLDFDEFQRMNIILFSEHNFDQ